VVERPLTAGPGFGSLQPFDPRLHVRYHSSLASADSAGESKSLPGRWGDPGTGRLGWPGLNVSSHQTSLPRVRPAERKQNGDNPAGRRG
jgi:hypothetical protein